MQLVLRGADSKIRATFTDEDGSASAPTSPIVTVTRDSDGEEIVTAGTCTDEGDGVVSYTLDGDDIPTVDLLTATWAASDAAAGDSVVGVVGGFLCSLEDVEATVGGSPTVPELRQLREEIEERLERICNVAFRPSYARETITGTGRSRIVLDNNRPLAVISATLNGVDIADELSFSRHGLLARTAGLPCGSTLNIAYSHGWPLAPSPVRRAALRLAADASSGDGGLISRFREDDQEFWLSVADGNRSTGIPEVDRVVRDFGYPVLGR